MSVWKFFGFEKLSTTFSQTEFEITMENDVPTFRITYFISTYFYRWCGRSKSVRDTLDRFEILTQTIAQSAHVVALFDAWYSEWYYVMVMECMDATLYQYIADHKDCLLTKSATIGIIDQVLVGLEFIHEKNIVHRDLHVENVLVKSSDFGTLASSSSSPREPSDGLLVKIGDFGRAVFVELEADGEMPIMTQHVLPVSLRPPELMFCGGTQWKPHRAPGKCRYDCKLDIWHVEFCFCCLVKFCFCCLQNTQQYTPANKMILISILISILILVDNQNKIETHTWSVAELAMWCRGHGPLKTSPVIPGEREHAAVNRMLKMFGKPSEQVVQRWNWSIPGLPAKTRGGLREPYKSAFPPAERLFEYDPSLRVSASLARKTVRA